MGDEVPKWMKDLEEQRERRLKARLGHEAGAGSPCLTCEEKCPGLDLHFWRKICKNCKCGKENHNVSDEDVYGWAEFQLLGSKPNKRKKFVIPGRKDAVELDWIPKGVADAVESYLKDLPLNLLPIKGSPAALERKQLLQKQIPLHDIDPSLCHALSEKEIQQMNDYITYVKQNSVGVGRVIKLNELLVAGRSPLQVPQNENIVLQGANRTGRIQKKLSNLKLSDLVPNNLITNENDYQNVTTVKPIQDLLYTGLEGVSHNQHVDSQDPQVGYHMCNVHYPNNNNPVASMNSIDLQIANTVSNTIDVQNPVKPGGVYDVVYFPGEYDGNLTYNNNTVASQNSVNLLIPNSISNTIDVQNPVKAGGVHDVLYLPSGKPTYNDNAFAQNPTQLNALNLRIPNSVSNTIDLQTPVKHGVHDISYLPSALDGEATYNNETVTLHNPTLLNSVNQHVSNTIDVRNPVKLNSLHDLKYIPTGLNGNVTHDTNTNDLQILKCLYDVQLPAHSGNVQDLTYTNPTCMNHKIENYAGCIQLPTLKPITNIKDLAYSTYKPQPSNNPDETNLTPTHINVGLIKDIEYPIAPKSDVLFQNITEPALPRKNVQFNLVPEEIVPSCHKCRKVFDATALVIGVNHTHALWHSDCFKCAGCNQNLADLMYFYDKNSDDVYCGRDYAKIRGIPRCQACDELIFVKEYCLAENSTFHVKHFCCFECDVPLAGQNYVMEESQPLCLPCYELVKAEKCNTCLKVIKPDEQGANLKDVHFHADDTCFVCKLCAKPLLGAKLLFRNNNLYCSAPCFGADK